MSSVMRTKVNDKFKYWMNRNYDKHGAVKKNIGKLNEYLGMNLDFTEKGKVKIKIDNYVERIINELPTNISKSDTA